MPTTIPIHDIADMTIRKKDNYYAFAMTDEPLSPYLEVMEYTKHYLHIMSMFVLCWCYACIITHYNQYDVLSLRNKCKNTFAA